MDASKGSESLKVLNPIDFLLEEKEEELVLEVTGWSMGYKLGPSFAAVVKKMAGIPKFGDVVLARNHQHFFVHRVIKVDTSTSPPTLVTKGDNCNAADPQVKADAVVGCIVGVVKQGKRWLPWHWRQPVATVIAFYSYAESLHRLYWISNTFRRFRYLWWRLGLKLRTALLDKLQVGGSNAKQG